MGWFGISQFVVLGNDFEGVRRTAQYLVPRNGIPDIPGFPKGTAFNFQPQYARTLNSIPGNIRNIREQCSIGVLDRDTDVLVGFGLCVQKCFGCTNAGLQNLKFEV